MQENRFRLKDILKKDLNRFWDMQAKTEGINTIGIVRKLKLILKRPVLMKLIIFRCAQASVFNKWFPLLGIPVRMLNYMTSIILGIQIPVTTRIGGGLYLCHWGTIVVSKKAVLGENVVLFHDVTIGHEKGKCPVIGNNVYIAPGAKIFGEITIGDNCKIGANAVVNKSFPADCTIAGIPAKIVKRIESVK
ncbi:serine acetyltransferase [candidate division KSB1 bacterium]|nr:serine acetyltransferase [candidate division KSB1 bacterium]